MSISANLQIDKYSISPKTNGQCECLNLTFINMIGTLSEKDKLCWKDFGPTLVDKYSSAKSSATDFSPYYLIYGRRLKLALGLYFGTQPSNLHEMAHTKFVQQLKERLQSV